MIQPITKLIQISPVTEHERAIFRLDTADGRQQLADRIESDVDEWCQQAFDDGPRSHLGASVIGGECNRAIWYSWRWWKYKSFSGQMLRLFQFGHHFEDRMIQMLVGIGCEVIQVDPATGKQWVVSAVHGHFGGSGDGILVLSSRYGLFPPMLVEFKTANAKSFAALHDLEHSKPQHFGQTSVYGKLMNIKHVLYIVENKNDSDIKYEIKDLDWSLADNLINKAEWIITSNRPPPKLTENVSDYRCKCCDFYSVCQTKKAKPDINCRTCKHSQPIENKQWRCNRWNGIIPGTEAALAACNGHELLVE